MKLSHLARTAPFAHFFTQNPKAEDVSEEERKKREAEEAEAEDDDEEAKAKAKAKAESESEEEEEEEERKPDAKAKAAAEAMRVRCAAIVAYGMSIGQAKPACSLAFDSAMSVDQAKAFLDTLDPAPKAQAPARQGLRERMSEASHDLPNPGTDGGPAPAKDSTAAMAAMVIAAGERAVRMPVRR